MSKHNQKKLDTGKYEYRDTIIEKRKVILGTKESWVFKDTAGTNFNASTLKKCKEWIDNIESSK